MMMMMMRIIIRRRRSSATAEIARDADVAAHSLYKAKI